ncbi:S8 family peptidase [Bacillus safensis]|uniref:S8 family peptidase n=1 Tax=Bacillus safensis TaxID=561879 RepID=UPI00227E818E|nr:S8 family peptidase [Bacillus safensis]MCY7433133.1 S8 family peptidase [Bacillus safensis]
MERKDYAYPIKLVSLRKEDIKPNQANGGGKKIFRDVTTEFRVGLSSKIENVERMFEQRFREHPNTPGVAKVTLRNDAIAKSHRPTSLFTSSTCPIIGVGNSDELLVEVNSKRLNDLKQKIMSSNAKSIEANISTLENIEPFLPEDALKVEVKEYIEKEELELVKIKLFKFFNKKTNNEVESEFESHLKKNGATIKKKVYYAKHLTVYKVEINNRSKLRDITNFGAIKSLSYFPTIETTQFSSLQVKSLEEKLPVFSPNPNTDYPYVGVVDSGIREDHIYLKEWVTRRENFVKPELWNNNHGSFVSGIIAYGNRLTSEEDVYDGVKIIDVTAIPNSDTTYGPTGTLDEEGLIQILREVIPKYNGRVKVWNLSLNSEIICDEQGFSDLAIALDEIQDENDVTFVISAGNYKEHPPRVWPVNDRANYDDVITSPADSVRSITVGSISHLGSDLSKEYCPSPFSRRGPGPNYITKPELVDFGGNLNLEPYGENGVISFNEDGRLTEDIGTSFSAPRVSALLSKIHHYLDERPSRSLAKALLIHSAIDKRINKRPKKEERPYLGFGQPQSINSVLQCSKHSSTIIFEGTINPSMHIEINDFPFPSVLTEGNKCFGEIFITLVYDPPLNSDYSFEYCRSNIEVSLGTNKPSGYSSEVPLERMGALERELIENGMKWAPIKVYHRKISNRGINNYPWKLKLNLSGRSEEQLIPQDFTLIVTMKDPQNQKEVYNDVAQQLQQRFIYTDIQVNNRIRPILE